jgi:RNA polymerase sigma factor (sigma-70 family)
MSQIEDESSLSAPGDLLALLDPDPVRAEARYRELRSQLVRFFEWQQCPDPEEVTQETLARGFRRIAGGVDTSTAGVRSYFFGIARNLVKESWTPPREVLLGPTDWERTPSTARDLERVEARLALKQCLGHLKARERRLIIRYYTEDRPALSRELGVRPGHLRLMVHRIKRKIDELRKGPGGAPDGKAR